MRLPQVRLPRVTGVAELLDAPDHDPAELRASLAHVAAVNRWLGGNRALQLALRPFLREGLRVLDIGTGSADLPLALTRAARRRGLRIDVTAAEPHPQTRAIAAERCRHVPEIRVVEADALALDHPPGTFDVALLSLVLHHFEDDAAVTALRAAGRVAAVVIVNELHRTRLNHAGARLLAWTIWRRNRITRHDGPLSVQRAYRPRELRALAAAAGLRVLQLRRRWFQRVVLVATRAAATPG
ncbi:MAG TPA: methyltransferase domain-containing protein [Longimicrobiales bacterium]|nr:methyltransferase domain-containing protein [Longimicrobiales bacterium]